MKVYLAGPITGCSYKGATTWREAATRYLARYGLTAFSPMRNKEYLGGEEEIALSYNLPEHFMSQPKHLFNRDKNDVLTSNALLINLYGAERISIGTMFELAWAHILNIPTVVVMELDNLHVHPFVTESASFVVPNLDMGCEVIIKLLTNGETKWVDKVPDASPAKAIQMPFLSKNILRHLEHQAPGKIVEQVPALQTLSENSETKERLAVGTTTPEEERIRQANKTRMYAKLYGANFPEEEMI